MVLTLMTLGCWYCVFQTVTTKVYRVSEHASALPLCRPFLTRTPALAAGQACQPGIAQWVHNRSDDLKLLWQRGVPGRSAPYKQRLHPGRGTSLGPALAIPPAHHLTSHRFVLLCIVQYFELKESWKLQQKATEAQQSGDVAPLLVSKRRHDDTSDSDDEPPTPKV